MVGKLNQTGDMQPLLTQEEIADLLAPMEHEAGVSAVQAQQDRTDVIHKLDALSMSGTENSTVSHKNSVPVRVEVGRGRIADEDFLKLKKGSIVPLEKRIDEPLDLYVDDHLIARGEIVRVNNKLGFKVTDVTQTQLSSKPE